MDNKDIDISGLLYLCNVPRLGPLRIRALMSRFESPEKILSASARKLAEVPGIDLVIAKNVKTAVNKEFAERQIDRAKSEFVSVASHQLRTPLGIEKWLEIYQVSLPILFY